MGERADGRTDMKLIVALRNFASAPKNVSGRHTNFNIANTMQLHVSAAYSSHHQAVCIKKCKKEITYIAVAIHKCLLLRILWHNGEVTP